VADLDADGFAEVTIFYTLGEGAEHRPSIAVLSKTAAGYRVMWEHPYTDGYSSTFAEPTGVYDVNGSGRPQIVAYHTVGASCPGILEIYEYANGSAKAITGDWAGSCQSELEIRDLDGDGIKEIIFRTLKYGTNREIYHWNRNQYVRSNEHFAQHYDDDLNQLVSDVYSDKPYPASARVTWCEQAVQIYTLQKRFSEAIEMCRAVLRMLDQPSLTVPSSVSTVVDSKQQQSRLVASLEADKAKGKGNVYRLLGQLYRATGDLKRSDRCYRAAHQFEAQAQTKAMSLSH
jgi:tetratricopeptide (TPR) repeat protein